MSTLRAPLTIARFIARPLRKRSLASLLRLPQTMSGLVIAACLLAATPLLMVTVIYVTMLGQLTAKGQALIHEGLRIERLGAELRRDLEDLERGGLHYLALGHADLLQVIERRRGAAEITLRQLRDGLPPATAEPHLQRLDAGLAAIAQSWTLHLDDREALQQSMQLTHELSIEVDGLISRWRQSIDDRVLSLNRDSARARQLNPLSLLALIALTSVLAYLSSRAVARPVRHLHRAIGTLGASDYSTPIRIVYPREMAVLGEKLEWLRGRLQRLEQDKERFLRHISHELKTPLASMREGIDLLNSGALGPLSARQAEVAAIIAESSGELDSQINNLLAYTRWRHERKAATAAWFDSATFINSVIGAHQLTLRRRNLRVVQNIRTPQLYGQREHLRVALDNLFGNALKHGPAGSAIEIDVTRDDACWRLSVRDHGKGIRKEERRQVLEPFVRGSADEDTAIRGTGIGLSIVHEAVRAHGGELEILDAEPGARLVMVWPIGAAG